MSYAADDESHFDVIFKMTCYAYVFSVVWRLSSHLSSCILCTMQMNYAADAFQKNGWLGIYGYDVIDVFMDFGSLSQTLPTPKVQFCYSFVHVIPALYCAISRTLARENWKI